MNDLRPDPKATPHEEKVTADQNISASLVLSLFCLAMFLGGVFTTVSPGLFNGGVFGLRTDYVHMDQQGRGFSMLIDSVYSITLGVVMTFVSSFFGLAVGVASGFKSLRRSPR